MFSARSLVIVSLVAVLLSVIYLSSVVEASVKCKGYHCPKPSPSPVPTTTVPRNPSPSLVPIPTSTLDIYPVTSFAATCFSVLNTLTSLNNLGTQTCLSIVKCITWWIQHYLQLALRGLTTGATLNLSLTFDPASLAWTRFETLIGGRLNTAASAIDPNFPTTCVGVPTSYVLASNGLIYPSECAARLAGVAGPYVPVTITTGSTSPSFPTDVANPTTVLTTFYIQAALRFINFLLSFLNSCLLSTDVRVLTSAVSNLTQALSLINSGDLTGAKALVLAVTRTL